MPTETKIDEAQKCVNGQWYWPDSLAYRVALEAEIEHLGRLLGEAEVDLERLNQMLRQTGYGQGQIDAYVAQCEQVEQLQRERDEAKAEVERIRTTVQEIRDHYEGVMPDDRKCPRCGSKASGYYYYEFCENDGCGLPYRFWDDWERLQRERDELKKTYENYVNNVQTVEEKQIERLLAFVREQFCECVNEHGQNRTGGPCDRCKLLGEDGRK